jgi:hypothetical protein
MPTGYTSIIDDDETVTFERFVWRCARGMGTLLAMRDSDMDAPIPERFEPYDYYAKALADDEAKLAELRAMTPAQIESAAQREQATQRDFEVEYEAKKAKVAARYAAMATLVGAWHPPSPDHVRFKDFMLEQLQTGKPWDGQHDAAPVLQPGDWHAAQLKRAEVRVADARKSYNDEIERTRQNNEWLAKLRASVPQP